MKLRGPTTTWYRENIDITQDNFPGTRRRRERVVRPTRTDDNAVQENTNITQDKFSGTRRRSERVVRPTRTDDNEVQGNLDQ